MELALVKENYVEIAIRHCFAQGKKSILEQEHGVTCAYRGADGLMCAIGRLIPDDKYDTRFEGLTVCDDIIRKTLGVDGVECDELCHHLQIIQEAHDLISSSDSDKGWFNQKFSNKLRKLIDVKLLPEKILAYIPEEYQR